MKKVLFTASTYSHICNFHLPYLRAFQERGAAVHVACGGQEREIPCADRIVRLPLEKKMWAPGNFRAARMLRREIKSEGYDLVVTHTSLAAFFTRLALMGMGRRPAVINMAHGYLFDDETPFLKKTILLTAERLVAGKTDLVLTMNGWDTDAARRYKLGRKIEQVPGVGVDFSRFDGLQAHTSMRERYAIPEDAFVLVYAAEFSGRKSQAVLIRAMGLLPEKAVLALPGEGDLLEECKALAKSLGLEKRVIFPGHVASMADWYAMADGAVSSSRIEGLPFNVMEAMYCGLPVIASAVKGHVDLIQDGVTGLLYPYGDEKACAACIQRLMEDEDLRRRMADKAKKEAEQYSLEKVFPQVMDIYWSMLSE